MKLFFFFFLILQVFGHSWLECTKYNGDLEDFERDQCEGLPRPLPGNRNVGGTFGADIGMDFRPQAGGARCQGSPTTGTPTQVSYEAGRTYTLAWAPKNHVAAECTNAFIPDNFLRIYMAPYNGATDPTQDEFKQNQVPASFSDDPHVSGTIDYKGFQNCPKFCENTDKALCTGTITIPPTTTPGVYTFQWYWAFNSETDLYATCWEAEVLENTGGTDGGETGSTGGPETTTTTTATPKEPCFNCCESIEAVAMGTGEVITVPEIERGMVKYLDCPQGFDGQLKYQCLENEGMSPLPRLIDGYCQPTASGSEVDDQKGTVVGLSLTLTFTWIAFIIYCLCVNNILTWEMVQEFVSPTKTEEMDPEQPPKKAPKQAAASSGPPVFSTSSEDTKKTSIPDIAEWHYVNENDETVGPVTKADFSTWVSSVGSDVARQTFVWNGKEVSEWTLVTEVPMLSGVLRGAHE